MHITTDKFSIRPVSSDEIDAILAVYRQCEDFLALGPVPTASLEMVQADLRLSQSQNGVFCGIFDPGGTMVGVLDVIPQFESSSPFLELLMIAAPYRSKGLGAEVVRVMETELRCDPTITAIRAGVQANNPKAIRFWNRMGFKIVGGPRLIDQTTCYDLLKEFNDDQSSGAGKSVL
jgi:ribosomal protein S18 acetylase RimI-like enzyme